MSAKTMVDTWVRMSSRDGGTGMYVSHGVLLILKDCIDSEFADRVKAHGLREELFSLGHKYRRVCDDNVKLRELARHMRACIERGGCTGCPYAEDACDFDYDMRELGIEGSETCE